MKKAVKSYAEATGSVAWKKKGVCEQR